MTAPPNHALQRTRRERRGCNRCVPCAGSLSLARSATSHIIMRTFTRVRTIANLLRFLAFCWILSGVVFCLPKTWIDSFLVWVGMAQVPDALLMSYVLRGAGLLQVAMGIVIWAVASDVVRYRPIVITIIVVHLAAAPAFYLMDAVIGMPGWWCLMDFTCGILSGGIPLIFCLWPAKAA